MRQKLLLLAVAAALIPASMASAYTLTMSNNTLAAPPLTSGTVNITATVGAAGGLSLYSANMVAQIDNPGFANGLRATGSTGLLTGYVFQKYSYTYEDPDTMAIVTKTSSTSAVTDTVGPNQYRGVGLTVPLDENGLLVAQTLTNDIIARFTITYPAGLPVGKYIISMKAPGSDTFVAQAPNNVGVAPTDVVAGYLEVLPEPAALALLAVGGLFLRRRRA